MTDRLCGSQTAYEIGCRFGGKIDCSDTLRPICRCHATVEMWNRCPYRDAGNLEHEMLWRSLARKINL